MPDDNGPLSIERMVISIKLINYLEDFMMQIQLLRRRDRKELSHIITRLTEMRTELTTWWDSIPDSAFNVDRSADGQAFRSCMHLRLLYCLIRMFIGRPFLFTDGRLTEDSPSSPPDARKSQSQSDPPAKHREASTTSTSDGKRRPSRRFALVQTTIDAAVEALDLCRVLYDGNEGLARASYIEYSSCRASMLALIAYSIQEQTDQYREIMQKGLEMSREMSAAGESARAESALIEALERAVARLQMFGAGWQRRESRPSSAAQIPQPRHISNYDRFKHWQQSWKRGGASQSGEQTPNMPPPTSAWDQQSHSQQQQQNSANPMSMDNLFDQSSPYNGSDTAGYVMPNAPPSMSDGDSTGLGFTPVADAAFFQALGGAGSGMPTDMGPDMTVTPSAAAVNGWLTQARPERQVLDHFLAMPLPEGGDGFDVASLAALGYPPQQQPQGSGHQQQQAAYGSNGGNTSWFDIAGTANGNHLPRFGGW